MNDFPACPHDLDTKNATILAQLTSRKETKKIRVPKTHPHSPSRVVVPGGCWMYSLFFIGRPSLPLADDSHWDNKDT
jgi:hypothetical protein